MNNEIAAMRVELRFSPALRAVAFFAVALGFLPAVAGLVVIGHSAASEDLSELTAGFLGLVFFGDDTLVFVRRLIRPSGAIEIQPEGLLVSCYSLGPFSGILGGYACWGFAGWRNLAAASVRKAQSFTCLALCFKDLDAFIASRAKLIEKDFLKDIRLGQQSGRIFASGVNR